MCNESNDSMTMKPYEQKRNAPVATLIRQFCNKKSGKVSTARNELRKRFDYLDWRQQKKIMEAFLHSAPSDRQWVYPKLLRLWEDSYEETIQRLWEEYHEERCSWLIVRHFPRKYIMDHLNELLTGRNYFFICLRFGSLEDFQIEKDQLTPFDYLYLMYTLEREMTDEEAMNCFYRTAQWECNKPSYYAINMPQMRGRRESPSPLHIKSLNQAYYYISAMNLHKAADECKEWEEQVKAGIQEELSTIADVSLTDMDYNEKIYVLLQKSIAEHLPPPYKSLSLDQISEQNSAVRDLIDEFELEEVPARLDDCPF